MSHEFLTPLRRLFHLAFLLAVSPAVLAQSAPAPPVDPQPEQLLVDLAVKTGPVLHGAAGWLYGQSSPGIPTVSIMEPLHPQIAAQKPAGGLQHPMGDASLVASNFQAAGGRLMQIYMQDIYPDWPYNDHGIDEYLGKVEAMTRQIVADPHHDLFVYVPFNEPNNNWYADHGPKFTKFLGDWTLVYRKIRSIDPKAKIAGPGFEHFNAVAFETFLRFAQQNSVLPDEFTWHELHDDFFPQWYRSVDQYRAAEARLGISPLPIVINEYVRDRGDLAVPGNLVQWIARLENSKVYGCLAFWTPAGTLSDLTARIWPNRPTGGWWLYQWYGSMTGSTVKVTPPDRDAPGLQGVAAVDLGRQQVRMIFGGTAKPMRIDLRGLDQFPSFQRGVHVTLTRIGSSGVEASPGPQTIADTNLVVSDGTLAVSVPAASADAAYSLILTPAVALAAGGTAERTLMAVDADFTGKALYSEPRGSGVALGSGSAKEQESVRFLADTAEDGYYLLALSYAATGKAGVQVAVDDEPARPLTLAPHAGTGWGMQTMRLYLGGGIHRIRFQAAAPVTLHSLQVQPTPGEVSRYPATMSQDVLRGKSASDSTERPESEFLEFSRVIAKHAGDYAIVITYANDEAGHKGQVDERAELSVNSAPAGSVWFRNTFKDRVFATVVVRVHLLGGENHIRFTSPAGSAPIIQAIQVAKADG